MTSILVVDDYSVTQRMLGHMLRRAGYIHFAAQDGFEALDILEQEQLDLVICDIAMPEMDGLTLLGKIRADERFVTLPIIMLTASGQDEDRVTAEDGGANGFLTKPVSSQELLSTIEKILG